MDKQKLLYGTGNRAKLDHMRQMLASLNIEIIGLNDMDVSVLSAIPAIEESGSSPLENARIKAHAYYKAFHVPCFSCDSGLYIENAPDDMQPGVHVRNVGGLCLSDDEMIAHYSALAQKMGGSMMACYKNAICFVIGDREVYEHMDDDIAYERFMMISKPHHKRVDGFPLDSLSIDIKSGKYFYDLEKHEYDSTHGEGFRNFFKQALHM